MACPKLCASKHPKPRSKGQDEGENSDRANDAELLKRFGKTISNPLPASKGEMCHRAFGEIPHP
jgi:hypothetical protein